MQTDKVLKKVHKEKALVLSSVLVTMLLLGVGGYFLYLMIKGEFPYVLGIGFLAVFVATLVISYGYAPMSVELSDQSLTLYRGIGKKVFKFSEIKNVEVYISNGAVVRTCGVGGLFGFTGRYYAKRIGNYFSYVGDYSQTFYIERKDGKKYVLSCDDYDFIVSFIKKNLS